ncbi:MAG: hypothetical protein LBM96_11970 [Methanobrevibacter sp.]|nr:hypothetical protein [Candidatus Methanoflexus mossambicus]
MPDGSNFNFDAPSGALAQSLPSKNKVVKLSMIKNSNYVNMKIDLNPYVKKVNWHIVNEKYIQIKNNDLNIPKKYQKYVYNYQHKVNKDLSDDVDELEKQGYSYKDVTDKDSLKFKFNTVGNYFIWLDFLDSADIGYYKGLMINLTVKSPAQPAQGADLVSIITEVTLNKKVRGDGLGVVLRIYNTGNKDTTYKAKLSKYGKKYLGYSLMRVNYKLGKISKTQNFIVKPIKVGKYRDIRITYPQVIPYKYRAKVLRTVTLNVGNYVKEVNTQNNVLTFKI